MISSSFPGDPFGHASNQCGHAMIGFGLWLIGAALWPGLGNVIAAAVGILYFLTVEWAWQRLKLFWDSVEDACHVTFGAALPAVVMHSGPNYALMVFAAWGAVLGFGMWRRK